MKKSLIILLSITLAACAGVPFSWDNARQIKVGMTSSEVRNLMGKPYLISGTNDNKERWNWTFVTGFGSMRTFNIFIKDGKVVDVPSIPDDERFND